MSDDIVASGRRTLGFEAGAIARAARQLDGAFARAVELLRAAEGQVIVSGVGKSGLIAQKVAATLTSTDGSVKVEVSLLESRDGRPPQIRVSTGDR